MRHELHRLGWAHGSRRVLGRRGAGDDRVEREQPVGELVALGGPARNGGVVHLIGDGEELSARFFQSDYTTADLEKQAYFRERRGRVSASGRDGADMLIETGYHGIDWHFILAPTAGKLQRQA